jgi:hypothetical protein
MACSVEQSYPRAGLALNMALIFLIEL